MKEKSKKTGFMAKLENKFKHKKKIRLEARDKREELWNTVGYHRITGGFFYGYILMIGGTVIGLLTLSVILPLFLPYPEINGMKGIVTGSILGYWFGLFDLNMGGGGGFSDGVSRFIGQYSDTNPRRAIKYIQFYIWFQMFTGIVQVTIFIFLGLFYFIHTSFAYLAWFIVGQSLVQYPGMLMIMESSLKAFQRGDKTAWLSWLQDTVFQVSINIIFLVIGKFWGASHPEIGELMGITLFYILSQFMDDWINLLVGSKMFASVLKPYGIRMRDLFTPQFDKAIIKECLTYTGKQWIGGQIKGFIGMIIGLWIVVQFPSMAFWSGLMSVAGAFGNMARMQGPMMGSAVPAFSESYNNGKKELCRYFIHSSFKYYAFITGFFMVTLAILSTRIITFLTIAFPDLRFYVLASILVPSVIITEAISPIRGLWGKICNACDRPLAPIIIDYITTPLGYAMQFLFLYLCVTTNTLPVWALLIYPGFITGMAQTIIGFAYIQRSIIKIDYKKIAGQVIIAPTLAALTYAVLLFLISYTAWPALNSAFNWLISTISGDPASGEQYGVLAGSLVILLLAVFLFPGLVYGPFLALYGGWDDFTLDEFKKCAIISGPSKGITMMIYKVFKFFSKLTPLHGKFPMGDYDKIQAEAEALVAEGKANRILKT
ncbi:MAG: hypothetical protein ACTSUE_07305 [Promethearchaeota archaeon]